MSQLFSESVYFIRAQYVNQLYSRFSLWANALTLENCREELQSALEGWILVRLAKRQY